MLLYKLFIIYFHSQGVLGFWNDPQINIDWFLSPDDLQLSDKDKKLPLFNEVNCFNYKNLH